MRRPTRQRVPPTPQRHPALDYRPPAYLTALKWGGIGTAVVALVVAAYVGFWFYAAGELRDGALAWIEARRSEGMTANYARLDIGGFPFALRLHVSEPAIAAPAAPTPWGWEGKALEAEMRPWSPHRFTIRAAGEQGLVLTVDGKPHVYRGQAGRAAGEFRYDGNRLHTAHIELADVKVTEAANQQNWTLDRATLNGELPPVEEATHRTPVLDLRLHVAGLTLPAPIQMPLGNDLAELEIGATLLGPIEAGPLNDSLAKWRDDGGTVDVRRLSAQYGPLALNADGTLALDGELQPVGAFTARVEGFFETVDALRVRGIIRAADAVTAKMILGVLVKRNGSGRSGLTIPMSIQDRHLFAGPVPLIQIPEISWSGG